MIEAVEPYSITSSARAMIDCGTARPSTLAVPRLMASLNLVGRCTGRSAGRRPSISIRRKCRLREGHHSCQPRTPSARRFSRSRGSDKSPERRAGMPAATICRCRLSRNCAASTMSGPSRRLGDGGDGVCVDFTFSAGLPDDEVNSLRTGGFLNVSDHEIWVTGLFEFTNKLMALVCGSSCKIMIKQLWHQPDADIAEACQVPARVGETGHETRPDRVADVYEYDRDLRGGVFRRSGRGGASHRKDPHRPFGRRGRRPMRAADHSGPRRSDIRTPRFAHRRNRLHSAPG